LATSPSSLAVAVPEPHKSASALAVSPGSAPSRRRADGVSIGTNKRASIIFEDDSGEDENTSDDVPVVFRERKETVRVRPSRVPSIIFGAEQEAESIVDNEAPVVVMRQPKAGAGPRASRVPSIILSHESDVGESIVDNIATLRKKRPTGPPPQMRAQSLVLGMEPGTRESVVDFEFPVIPMSTFYASTGDDVIMDTDFGPSESQAREEILPAPLSSVSSNNRQSNANSQWGAAATSFFGQSFPVTSDNNDSPAHSLPFKGDAPDSSTPSITESPRKSKYLRPISVSSVNSVVPEKKPAPEKRR
jgi:hypothetical protein